jgi:hypothetical protein
MSDSQSVDGPLGLFGRGGESTNVTKTFCYIHSRPQIYFHNISKMGVQLSCSYIGKARYSIRSEEKRQDPPQPTGTQNIIDLNTK